MLSLTERARLRALQCAYERARDRYGVTIEEWEHMEGLPPFSVYPQMARRVGRPRKEDSPLREAWRKAAAKCREKKASA